MRGRSRKDEEVEWGKGVIDVMGDRMELDKAL